MPSACCVGALAVLVASGVPEQASDTAARLLTVGVRQVEEGSFEEAVFTLDSVVRTLLGEPSRARELTQAYVYLGAAYVGLDHEEAARGKFREALKLEPSLRLSADRFPPRVVKLFEEQLLQQTAVRRKRSARTFLIIGGIAAGGAVGVAVSSRKTEAPPNRPPTGAGVTVSPTGQAIPGVTVMTFTATGADPDGDPLSFAWDFGDGAAGSGATVSHLYSREGCFTAAVTVSDDRGESASAQAAVTARALTGRWVGASGGNSGSYNCVQAGSRLECGLVSGNPEAPSAFRGALANPRRVELDVFNAKGALKGHCVGEVQPDLNRIECTIGASLPYTLQREGDCP